MRGFSAFWAAFPRKKAKPDAEKAWRKLRPDDELVERILVALGAQARSEQWRKDGGQFVPYPATWIRGCRWEDEADRPAANTGAALRADAFDWFDECKALHGGECGGRSAHATRVVIEAGRAERAAGIAS